VSIAFQYGDVGLMHMKCSYSYFTGSGQELARDECQ
jgi:hypothetical protein